jgi:NADPH2:quinone reductase
MKAVWYTKNGSPEDTLILGDIQIPEPSEGEVRVKLKTSGVNPSDVKSRIARPLNAPFIIPHSDGAGIIEKVGSGVDSSRVGERVWIWNAQWGRAHGSACEYIVLKEQQAVHLPSNTTFEEGACLGIPLLTAVQAINLCGDLKGKTVLVTGAASSVGHYAAQLAAHGGARVFGTVGSSEKATHAKSAGVEECIYYKTESVPDRIKSLTNGCGVDTIIDMDFSGTSQWLGDGVLSSHGTLVCFGSNIPGDININFRPLLFNSITCKFFLIYDLTQDERIKILQQTNHLLEKKLITHTIAKEYPLSEIIAAHQAVEKGQYTGNVVMII